jgi:hypothetical protein
MEKIMYLAWKHEGDSDKDFRQKLLGKVSQQIIDAGALKLRISVVDEDVAAAAKLRIESTKPPSTGLISIWTDTSIKRRPFEKAIQEAVARMAGYLVTESEPIVNTRHIVADGQRTPGMCQVAVLKKPPRLTYDHWIEIWLGSHTKVAIDNQSTFGYRQNVIARPLTYTAPQYDAIVEEHFPAGAMSDPMVFYDAAGDEAKLQQRKKTMRDSVLRFIDFDKIDCLPMSEYTLKS